MSLNNIGAAIGSGLNSLAGYSAAAAGRANGVSAAAQSAQGAFNQGSVNLANILGTDRLTDQYAFNSAQAAMANAFTEYMWDKSAAWNEKMWDKSAKFNHDEAEISRKWQEMMESSKYQRAVKDMEAAGLNPILAVTGGGISTGAGGGSAASIGAQSMSGAQGQAASGGLLQGLNASESSYSGQMEYMGGTLGLLSAAIAGVSSAIKALGGLGNIGKDLGEAFKEIFGNKESDYNQGYKKGFWKGIL